MPRKPPAPQPPVAEDSIDPLADLISPPPARPKRRKAAASDAAVAATAKGGNGKGRTALAKAATSGEAAPKGAGKGAAKGKPSASTKGAMAPKRKGAAKAAEPVAAPRRSKAVANAAAAAYGKTVTSWSEAEIVEAFSRFEKQDPEPKGELDHTDPYTLLVAVVLSAQATDTGVNKATKGLFAAASTPAAMVALGEEQVAHYIRTLGLFKNKAKNVVELSRLLLERHHGEVPRDREALEALPGVGRKTANVVLNIAFGEPTIAVDTHLFRVANRTGLAPGATPLAVEEALEARIPDRFKLHAHHWLILHGRYICKARQPECGRCLIVDLCRWPEKHF